MKKNEIEKLIDWHDKNQIENINDRYFPSSKLEPYLAELKEIFTVDKIGDSFEGRSIHKIVFGQGDIKILVWTQMHGNESTGTRSLLDLIKFFQTPESYQEEVNAILKACTIHCIPILNPDGAEAYTRISAEGIDLNRDVVDKRATESVLLQKHLKEINPSYCFNLHDQRTIFSVPPLNKTATMSFLAPSVDKERSLNKGRKETMTVISAINNMLQEYIPNQIGRYTDEFYPTATGDNFQKMGHNTILIESGHAPGDYDRKIARKATFIALIEGLSFIASRNSELDIENYSAIPNNEKKYLDVIYKGVSINGEIADLGVLFIEKLIDKKVHFIPSVHKFTDLDDHNADEIIGPYQLEFKDKKAAENWLKNRFN